MPCHRRETPDRFESSPPDRRQELRQLVRFPRSDLASRPAKRPRRFRPIGDVLRGQAGVNGVLESLVDDRVDVPDRLRAESAVAAALGLQPGVERVQHHDRQLLERP
jgi:hypothetical protein